MASSRQELKDSFYIDITELDISYILREQPFNNTIAFKLSKSFDPFECNSVKLVKNLPFKFGT